MSRFIAVLITAVALGTVGGSSLAAQASTNAQDQGKCWVCGDQWGFNPTECFYHSNWSFGQGALKCKTVYNGGGSTCELMGSLCGSPFFTALDGSAAQSSLQLAASSLTSEAGSLWDCQGRVVLRGAASSTEPTGLESILI